MNYEEQVKELETLLTELESNEITLEDMLSKYKKAIKLYNRLEKYLNEYQQQVKMIADNKLIDFDEGNINDTETD